MLLALATFSTWQFDVVVMLPVMAVLVFVVGPTWVWWRDRCFNLDGAAGCLAARPVVPSCDHPPLYDWAEEGL